MRKWDPGLKIFWKDGRWVNIPPFKAIYCPGWTKIHSEFCGEHDLCGCAIRDVLHNGHGCEPKHRYLAQVRE